MSNANAAASHPPVSVVLPVKNGELFLEEAIRSVLSQDYEPLECLIVDDHSVDRTAEIARDVTGVQLLQVAGRGLGSAWNTGVKAATGSLIAFQAADDIWAPNKLRAQIAYMTSHPDVHYCIGNTRYFIEPGSSPDSGLRPELLEHDVQLILMESAMVRSTAFERIGRFDESLSTAQEVDWCARANDAGLRLGRLDQLVLFKRVHGSNLTFDSSLAREGNQNLLDVLRSSIQRKRGSETQR